MRPMNENGMKLGSYDDHENQWLKCDLNQMRPNQYAMKYECNHAFRPIKISHGLGFIWVKVQSAKQQPKISNQVINQHKQSINAMNQTRVFTPSKQATIFNNSKIED